MSINNKKLLTITVLLGLSYFPGLLAATMDFEDQSFSEQPLTGSMVDLEFSSPPSAQTDKQKATAKIEKTTGSNNKTSANTPNKGSIEPQSLKQSPERQALPITPVQAQPVSQRPHKTIDTKTLVKQGVDNLSEVVDEEILDSSLDKALSLKAELDQLNTEVNQKVTETIESSTLLQNIINTDTAIKLDKNSSNQQLATPDLMQLQSIENFSEDEPEGFFGFLFRLPGYLFNIKNLAILAIAIIFLGWLFRAIRFVVNRIY